MLSIFIFFLNQILFNIFSLYLNVLWLVFGFTYVLSTLWQILFQKFIIPLLLTWFYNGIIINLNSKLEFTFLYQDSFTYQCDGIMHLHNLLFCLIFGIVIFVLAALLFTYFEYRLFFRNESILSSFFLFSNPHNIILNNSNRLFLLSLLTTNNSSITFLDNIIQDLLVSYLYVEASDYDLSDLPMPGIFEDIIVSYTNHFLPNHIIIKADLLFDYTSMSFWKNIFGFVLFGQEELIDRSSTKGNLFPFQVNLLKFHFNKTNGVISRLNRNMSFFFKYFYQITQICHGTLLETIWTTIPSLILLSFSIPSFILLYALDETCDSFECIKILGNQWYWNYDLIGTQLHGDVFINQNFDSYILNADRLKLGDLRLLEVDCPLIVSTNVSYRLLISSLDVLHCWTLPSIGVKVDACPGRVNLGYLLLKNSGQIYGQCSELCGIGHGFMPISVISISSAIPFNEYFS